MGVQCKNIHRPQFCVVNFVNCNVSSLLNVVLMQRFIYLVLMLLIVAVVAMELLVGCLLWEAACWQIL